jgi:hypothetical protein
MPLPRPSTLLLLAAVIAVASTGPCGALPTRPLAERVVKALDLVSAEVGTEMKDLEEREMEVVEEVQHLDEAVKRAVDVEERAHDAHGDGSGTCSGSPSAGCVSRGIDEALATMSRFASVRGTSKRQLLMTSPGGRALLAEIEARCPQDQNRGLVCYNFATEKAEKNICGMDQISVPNCECKSLEEIATENKPTWQAKWIEELDAKRTFQEQVELGEMPDDEGIKAFYELALNPDPKGTAERTIGTILNIRQQTTGKSITDDYEFL